MSRKNFPHGASSPRAHRDRRVETGRLTARQADAARQARARALPFVIDAPSRRDGRRTEEKRLPQRTTLAVKSSADFFPRQTPVGCAEDAKDGGPPRRGRRDMCWRALLVDARHVDRPVRAKNARLDAGARLANRYTPQGFWREARCFRAPVVKNLESGDSRGH